MRRKRGAGLHRAIDDKGAGIVNAPASMPQGMRRSTLQSRSKWATIMASEARRRVVPGEFPSAATATKGKPACVGGEFPSSAIDGPIPYDFVPGNEAELARLFADPKWHNDPHA